MVIQVGLAKFYGSSLPRPQIYEDVKYNSERVDPPTPPSAPLLSWAREVTWSMGGLASKRRKRSQGKIEGSLKKLRDLQDDDDDDGEGLHCKDSNPSSVDCLPANEGLTVSEEVSNPSSREAAPRTRTRAEKLKKVVSSSCEETDVVSSRASPIRGNRGKKKHRRNRD
ncbi:uncharacterized protein LOC131054130 [Cryptomeria japonica]|uniref:uncharacterized protein LOC131054130 n=1 Tax=Cryptomeria japonica TaxID=3369 RepID=UPI0027DA2D62|nr:uncharacterized protein LOC131054130 [Cryptomeria japonica]